MRRGKFKFRRRRDRFLFSAFAAMLSPFIAERRYRACIAMFPDGSGINYRTRALFRE